MTAPELSLQQLILQRQSVGALTTPAPDLAQLQLAVQAALAAPDHHRLHPTRFICVNTEHREAFGHYLAQALRDLNETDEQIQRALLHPLRAPMLLIAVTEIQDHPKVPAFEQLLSSGAAIQNLLLSLHEQGFACMWRTGRVVESNWLKQQFCLNAQDYISGIIYIGTAKNNLPERQNVNVADYLQHWVANDQSAQG